MKIVVNARSLQDVLDFKDYAAAMKLYCLAKRAVLQKLNAMRRFFTKHSGELLKKSIGCVCTSRSRM
ncbi:MAG: hypothetical protein L0228_01840 [Planctomycetes bacterium]|nr:hypothetical protein [Planctomycetota bacterium]